MSTPLQNQRLNKQAAEFNPLISTKAPVPEVMNGTVDLRKLSRAERRGLLEGPMITLTRNGNFVAQVHKRAFMATSLWANNSIQEHATTTMLALPASASRADIRALKVVIGWMSVSYIGGDKLRSIPMGQNTVEACKIYHAATVLDMRPYVSHIAAYFHRYIEDRTTLLGYHELDALQAATTPDNAVFKHLVKDLANRRHKCEIPDMDTFAAYLEKHPTLSRAMDKIDETYAAERKEKRKAAKAVARANYLNERAEERRIMAEERRREEFEANLKAARGGRSGGYGMAI